MASQKTPKAQSKSDFIRSLPTTMSGPAVVAKAKAAGIKLSLQLVYAVRGRGKPKGRARAGGGGARSGGKRASKAAFVRGLPAATPAKEVVAKAKALGMSLTESYVYNIRGAAKKRGGSGRAQTPGAGHGSPANHGSVESLLVAVGAEIGLARAIELLTAERRRVKSLLGS